ncbi:MAG: DNA methyltransferase [Synergistaceae bacterium]|nr:DNA methyltransferase [Synergistaceae bacterium]
MNALFNILGDMSGRSFLDLFSGTGRVAKKAADLGADCVVAVETLPARSREIRALFAGHPSFSLLSMDVRRALSFLRRKGRLFDVVFADPPYGAGWPAELPGLLFPESGGVLKDDGVAVIEHSARETIPEGTSYLVTDCRRYGDSALSFLTSASGREDGSEQKGADDR